MSKKSYGIICYIYDRKTIEPRYLVVKKRHSYSFITFMCDMCKIFRVHKSPTNEHMDRIFYLFSTMLSKEKENLMRLAHQLSLVETMEVSLDAYESFTRQNGPTQKNDTKMFSVQLIKYLHKHGITISPLHNIDSPRQKWTFTDLCMKTESSTPIWEFPKGRLSKRNEDPFYCARREFFEETKIQGRFTWQQKYDPANVEEIVGTDGNEYIYTYFTAQYHATLKTSERKKKFDIKNIEVSRTDWKTCDELRQLWRKFPERMKIVEAIDGKLKNR